MVTNKKAKEATHIQTLLSLAPLPQTAILFLCYNLPKIKKSRYEMIREVIRLQSSDFYLKIPAEYINKTVEFIMFPIDEYEPVTKTKNRQATSIRGSLNKYADSSKIALEDSAWQKSVAAKFGSND